MTQDINCDNIIIIGPLIRMFSYGEHDNVSKDGLGYHEYSNHEYGPEESLRDVSSVDEEYLCVYMCV